jgi:hypothetical protein
MLGTLCMLCPHCARCAQRQCVGCVQGISKNLVNRAFPEPNRPDYLTSEAFTKFTPTEDFMSLPGEILRTEFRLVVTHEARACEAPMPTLPQPVPVSLICMPSQTALLAAHGISAASQQRTVIQQERACVGSGSGDMHFKRC